VKPFPELVAEHGTAPEIPNTVLYDYLENNRQDILAVARLGVDQVPSSALGKEVRRRCKSDLMWLARYFTWRSSPYSENGDLPLTDSIFTEEDYGIFAKLFVQKDDSKKIPQQSKVKRRVLLWSRGGAKSTFDHLDTVQWVLNFPSVRILYLTATVDLAKGFVGEIKGHFYWKEDPTWMNLFWPEMCVEEGKSGPEQEFICPVFASKKTGRAVPTIFASSNGKAKAGWRFDVIKADDAVSDVNSLTDTGAEKTSRQLFLSEKLLALGGNYIDYIGTRYHDADHYGVLIEKNVGDITTSFGRGWEFHENKTTGTNILIGRAMTIKPEVVQHLERSGLAVSYQNAGPDGVILLLPDKMDYAWCMADYTIDEVSFESQRNQNPRPTITQKFTRTMLVKATIPFHEIPREGAVSQVWDFAFSKKKGRDYSVGTSVLWKEEDDYTDEIDANGLVIGRKKNGLKVTVGYVQEVVRSRFDEIQLAKAVVSLAQKYKPFIVGVEGAVGSNFLKPTLDMEAFRTQDQHTIAVITNIDWFSPDNQKDAKRIRMGSLYPPVVQGRLKFAAHCMALVEAKQHRNPIDLLYDEFEKCLESHHHDDIPDNLGMQQKYAPKATLILVSQDQEQMYHTDPHWNLIFNSESDRFGRVGFAPQPMTNPFEDDQFEQEDLPSEAPNGLRNVLGAGMFG
jgi:hypothetical protein